jgi:hypothetical protein
MLQLSAMPAGAMCENEWRSGKIPSQIECLAWEANYAHSEALMVGVEFRRATTKAIIG